MLKNSNRPLILVGNGVHISKAEKEFLNFLKKTNIPFVSTWNASDIVPSNNNFILVDLDYLEIELLTLQFNLVIYY